MRHLDEGTIHAWLDGALSAEEAARVELHLSSCETCSDAVAEARGLIAASSRILTALDDVPRLSGAQWGRGDRGDRRPFLVRWRIAATVALVVGGGALALAVRRDAIPTVALQASAERESAVTLAALDSPAAEVAAPTSPPNAERPALLRGDGASGRAAVGSVSGRTAAQAPARDRDLAGGVETADSAPATLAQLNVRAAAAPPSAPPARTDDTLRLPPAVAAEARVMADTARVADRSSVTEKLGGVLGARRSVADASARFAEPAAPRARPPAAPEANAPRLLTEERMTEADGGVVVRRVYRVEEVLVTLDERAPRELEQQEQAVSQERLQRLEERLRRVEEQAPAVPTASIRWVNARGAEFTLSGPVPREQLERFRKLLGH